MAKTIIHKNIVKVVDGGVKVIAVGMATPGMAAGDTVQINDSYRFVLLETGELQLQKLVDEVWVKKWGVS